MRDWNINDNIVESGRRRMQGDMMYLLDATTKFDSTDRRDRIFALWTLVRGTDSNRFRPDYNMTIQQVYLAVSTETLTSSAGLELLNRRWGAPRDDIPSWVPDYSVTPVAMAIFPAPIQCTREARSNKAPRVVNEQQQSVLVVPGFIVDSVCRVLSVDLSVMNVSKTSAERRLYYGYHYGYGAEPEEEIVRILTDLDRARLKISRSHPELRQVLSFAVEPIDASKAVALGRRLSSQAQGADVHGLSSFIDALSSLVSLKKHFDKRVTESLPRIEQLEQHERPFIDAVRGFAEVSHLSIRRSLNDSKISGIAVHGISASVAPIDDSYKFNEQHLNQRDDWLMRSVRALLDSIDDYVLPRLQNEVEAHIDAARILEREIYPAILLFEGSTGIQGIGSKDLKEGDKIAILEGYSSPCILPEVVDEISDHQKSYTFHGRAFLHIPDGPAQTSFKHKMGTTEPEPIRLE